MTLFGSSGIRELISRELIEKAFKIGLVLSQSYHSIIIGKDTRTSGDALKYAITSGLLAGGCQVYDAKILPTPSLAYATRKYAAGIMVTASHNPGEYNGIKLWNPDGSAFNSAQRKEIEMRLNNHELNIVDWKLMEQLEFVPDAAEQHMNRIFNDFKLLKNIKVAIDCGGGAASHYTPVILKQLGCNVTSINSNPTGIFPRNPEPVEENLMELCQLTTRYGASVGIAHDGDADRMMAVDEKGRFISGDKLLIILARELKAKNIITTVDASMLVKECGFNISRTKVGDAYVSEQLAKGGDFGGEPSGSWIFPSVSYCPDGIYSAALIVSISSKYPLSELAGSLPSYPIIRGSLQVPSLNYVLCKEILIENFSPVSVSELDGIRLEFSDAWLMVRKSGTEPRVRITVEARDAQKAEMLYNKTKKLIETSLKR